MKLRLPFIIISRKRYANELAEQSQAGYHEGYQACVDLAHEIKKARKPSPKPKQGRP